MTDRPKTGKRVQIYLPADLLDRWESIPRYERSAAVAAALRLFWDTNSSSVNVAANVAEPETDGPSTAS